MENEPDPVDRVLRDAADRLEVPAALAMRVRNTVRRRRVLYWGVAAAALMVAAWTGLTPDRPRAAEISLREMPPPALALSRIQLAASLRADRPGWNVSFRDSQGGEDDR